MDITSKRNVQDGHYTVTFYVCPLCIPLTCNIVHSLLYRVKLYRVVQHLTWVNFNLVTDGTYGHSDILTSRAAKKVFHMITHVCWTKMMFFENAKGWDQYFSTQDISLIYGIIVQKSNPFTFQYYCPKNRLKRPINWTKNALVWFGIIWLGQAAILGHGWMQTIFQIVQNSKVEN